MNKIIHPMEPEELMAYLDGELASDRAEAAAAHLSECAECHEVVAGLRRVSQGLDVWEVGSQEFRVPAAVSAALDENAGKKGRYFVARRRWLNVVRHRTPTFAWVGGLAAVFLVLIGTVRFIGGNANSVHSSEAVDRAVVWQSPNRPPAAPEQPQTKQFDRLEATVSTAQLNAVPEKKSAPARETFTSGPMIIRTSQLSLITKDFDNARASMESVLKRHRGYVGDLKTGGATGSGRTLTATLRVPADQLEASLTELKTLGRVESESQSGQDVTSQYVDLQARLANSRNTEQRLTDLLRNRTGKLSDVLEVEQEVDRVRGQIEQMEAERKNMSNEVSYATLNVSVAEDYKAQLQVVPPSTWTRLSNAGVEGYKSMVEGVMSLALFLLENGPSLLLWIAILFMPARLVWKRVRRSFAH